MRAASVNRTNGQASQPGPAVEDRSPQAAVPGEVFRQAVDQADLAISITDPKGNILFSNEAFSRVTGYSADEVLGCNESILSNHTTPREVYSAMWRSLASGRNWTGRLVNKRKNGELYLAELAISPVTQADGAICNYLGMHRDITDLHQLECQVRNQKRLIESVVDVAPVAFALVDVMGRVILDNQEYKKLVTDLQTREPALHVLDGQAPGWREQLLVKPMSCEFAPREIRFDRPQRTPRWFSCSASLVRMHNDAADSFFCGNDTPGLLVAITEITSLRMEQERARTAALQALLAEEERVSAIRESLAAAIFRLEEPINMMKSAIALLQRRDAISAGMLQTALDASREHLDALRQVIPPRGPEMVVSVNLNEILRDVLEVLTPKLLAAGVVVDWKPTPSLSTIHGRPLQLRVLFKALIENAIEAMDQKGWNNRELSVSTLCDADCVVVFVSDSGPGIPEAQRLQAFEPFFTTKNSAGRHLGTGLSRAQQIVADHGGFIDLTVRPAGGCSVSVEFRIDGDPL